MWTLICVIILGLIYVVGKDYQRTRLSTFPPGPPCLPIIGNLLSVWIGVKRWKLHHLLWQNLANTYGNLVGLKLGGVRLVIVFGKDMIKEVATREVFDGRPDGFFYLMRSFGKKLGLVFTQDPEWTPTRRVVLKYIKQFGVGTRTISAVIDKECQELVQLLESWDGKPVTVNSMFHIPVMNVLWQLVAGKRYDLNDERMEELCALIIRSFKVVNMCGGLLNYMPALRHVVPRFLGYTELMMIHDTLYSFIKETVDEHKRTLNMNEPRDVIDGFLIDMQAETSQAFSEEQLLVVCRDLMEAGLETVTNTLSFTLLYVALNPAAQDRIHREIDAVIGRRLPTIADRNRMVYMEATVMESLRLSSVPSVGIPHMAREDARLQNYLIPKGTFVLLALHDLHNGETWRDPQVFRPERFITIDGNIIQSDNFMPFGMGRRRCIGEGMARQQLFLFTTHILQRFHVAPPPGAPTPTTHPVDGVSLSPQHYQLVFTPRF